MPDELDALRLLLRPFWDSTRAIVGRLAEEQVEWQMVK